MTRPFVPGPLADPTGARAAAVLVKYAAPAAVLAGRPADVFGGPKVAANFADPGPMTYPVHTPAAAWVSGACYHDAGNADPVVADRIKRAFAYHRLGAGEWDRLAAAAAATPKEAAAPARYALPAHKKYPLDTAAQVRAAVEYFDKYAGRFSADDRRTYAGEVVKAAAAHPDVVPAEAVFRFEAEAGLGKAAKDWREPVRYRAALAGPGPVREALEKIANDGRIDGSLVGGRGQQFRTAGELAELLRGVDRRMGWDLPDPLPRLVADTPSTARAKLAAVVPAASGSYYRAAALDRVPDAVVGDLFGLGPVVSRQTKIALLAAPKTAAAFERVAAGHGVFPEGLPRRARVDWQAAAAGGVASTAGA